MLTMVGIGILHGRSGSASTSGNGRASAGFVASLFGFGSPARHFAFERARERQSTRQKMDLAKNAKVRNVVVSQRRLLCPKC